jgi:uncharacterized damage-inducible protein DinB
MSSLGGNLADREMLEGFLDWYRAIVVNKASGLSLEQATRVMTPSGLTVLGVIAHLASVEYHWFDDIFRGEITHGVYTNEESFIVDADATTESVIAAYHDACENSRSVAERTASLDEVSQEMHDTWGAVSLRWILVHMTEETARHAGHLDLMREQLDGRTGD